MSIKTSYSQNSTYKNCPQFWHWKYIYGLEPEGEGSSLYFGSAIDESITALLEGNDSYLSIFHTKWFSTIRNGQTYNIFDNNDINYAYADFDELVLTADDKNNMVKWLERLNLKYSDPIKAFKEIVKRRKNAYLKISLNETTYFNRCSWLSLKRKGELLIEAFKSSILPKIKKVYNTQSWGKIEDATTGDKIMGKLDMVLDFEGYDKPIIFDLKTSSRPYTPEQIELTEQLTLYSAMVGSEFNTDLVGYIVLVKSIPRTSISYCTNCGHIKEGRHKTCNETDLNGKRCGGEWIEKITLNPTVQVLVEKKSKEQVNNLLMEYGNIVHAMKEEIVYKNTEKCYNWYGSKCCYFDACHKNKFDNLKQRNKLV